MSNYQCKVCLSGSTPYRLLRRCESCLREEFPEVNDNTIILGLTMHDRGVGGSRRKLRVEESDRCRSGHYSECVFF